MISTNPSEYYKLIFIASGLSAADRKTKEHYAIFAKSFKEKLKEKNVYLFDLKDLEKKLK